MRIGTFDTNELIVRTLSDADEDRVPDDAFEYVARYFENSFNGARGSQSQHSGKLQAYRRKPACCSRPPRWEKAGRVRRVRASGSHGKWHLDHGLAINERRSRSCCRHRQSPVSEAQPLSREEDHPVAADRSAARKVSPTARSFRG